MEAARLRLRPILMTAFAFILGVVPLMIASGAGAASRQSIGTTVFGGMLAATMLTLVFVPVFYALIERLRERGRRARPKPRASPDHRRRRTARGRMKTGEKSMRAWKILAWRRRPPSCGGRRRRSIAARQCAGRRRRRRRAPPAAGHAGAGDAGRQGTMPVYLEYSARTESIRSITLQAQGRRLSRRRSAAADGADVKQGELLYKIDPRDFQAALDQAKAQAQRDVAAARLCARQFRSRRRARQERLARQGHVRPARQHAASGARRRWRWTRPRSGRRELNLGYTEIRAPFAGRLGRNQAPVGTLVSVAGAPLNTLVQLDPIYVTFNPSETDLAEIEQARARGQRRADVFAARRRQAARTRAS